MENKEKKIKLIERLIKSGEITLEEGLLLLETEKEQVFIPYEKTTISQPYINPCINNPPYYYGTGNIKFGNNTLTLTGVSSLNTVTSSNSTTYIADDSLITYTKN